ncbi:MAG: hypothetical protein WB542_01480 [Polaromonas sp.]
MLFLHPGVVERLKGNVKSDFVAVLEAIRHGLGHTVDPQLDLISLEYLDAF